MVDSYLSAEQKLLRPSLRVGRESRPLLPQLLLPLSSYRLLPAFQILNQSLQIGLIEYHASFAEIEYIDFLFQIKFSAELPGVKILGGSPGKFTALLLW